MLAPACRNFSSRRLPANPRLDVLRTIDQLDVPANLVGQELQAGTVDQRDLAQIDYHLLVLSACCIYGAAQFADTPAAELPGQRQGHGAGLFESFANRQHGVTLLKSPDECRGSASSSSPSGGARDRDRDRPPVSWSISI